MKTTRLSVRLCGVEPEPARVVDVPADSTLPELHDLLQAAMGWTDSHLHQFVTPDAIYTPDMDDMWPDGVQEESSAHLADLGHRFEYVYDLGDDWTHDVEVVGPGGDAPGCVEGHGDCPPEDCGGPGGYAELLSALAETSHPDHDRVRGWVGNRLRPFDLSATNQRVRWVAGEVPETVRLLLDLVGDGLKLTPGGRLPRVVARGMQQHRPDWHPLDRPASTEDDLWPLVMLHDLLRSVGLLRVRHGVLSRTRAAGDDRAVIRRLRTAFEPNKFDTILTELTVAQLAAHGPLSLAQLTERVHELLGPRWQIDGRPLGREDLRYVLIERSAVMTALDLVDKSDWHAWTAGRSALSLLPRATLLAEIFGWDD